MSNAPPTIFSRRQMAAKFARARSRQRVKGAANYLTETIAKDTLERIDFMRLQPEKALIVGDTSDIMPSHFQGKGIAGNVGLLGEFQEEQPGPAEMYNLIVHLIGLGHVNDLPGALIHARNVLTPDGVFIAAFPGAGSLPKLRQVMLAADADRPSARMHPLVDNRAGAGLLQRAGFAKHVVDTYPIRVRFPSLGRMIEDLRDHGLTRCLQTPSQPLTRAAWQRAQEAFDTMREDDGKLVEVFEILVLTGWR